EDKVVDLQAGTDALDRPWSSDTLVQAQSVTKGVLSTALHVLASQGKLDIDAPVADCWPEFKAGGKEHLLVRHVLSHSAGLHQMRARTRSLDDVFDYRQQVDALAAQRPAYEPGTKHGYHALTYGWLASALLEAVTGEDVRDAIRTTLADPLGTPDLQIGCPPDKQDRNAPCRFRFSPLRTATLPKGSGRLVNDPRCMDIPVPGVGGFFTADALATMYAMLAAVGTWKGRTYLTPEAWTAATTVQTTKRDIVMRQQMMWRLGYHGMRPHKGKHLPGAFGHFGFGGSAAWADPEHGLAAAFVTDRSTSLLDTRVPRLIRAMLDDVQDNR
ncbi:MAG: putative penicillin-binding protein, partial [Frankiales bacterium]|nr:putative penicillin-binding protein [Frankiales bacterium]